VWACQAESRRITNALPERTMPVQVTEWSEALMTSLAAAMALFFSAIPKILGFLVILVAGWIIASVLEKAITAVLRRVRFNQLAERTGLADFVAKMGMRQDAAGMLGLLAKWFVRLIALAVAFDALGLPAVSEVLRQLLLWLPNVVVALVVLVIGGLAARALSNIVRGMAGEAQLSNANFLSKVASVVVWAFAVVVAIHQLGIATELVNALFIAIVGAVALGLGLAFGLGGREAAGEAIRSWQAKAREKGEQIKASQAMEQDNTASGAGAWPTGGYPGPAPANRMHDVEGG
jgi:hypothetical protein